LKQCLQTDSQIPVAGNWGPRWSVKAALFVLMMILFGVWGWIDVRQRAKVDPQDIYAHRTDFTVYTEAGAAFFDGRDPYEVGNPRGWKYLYPPLFAILVAPLHALSPQAQVLIWFGASALMWWTCYTECVRIARAALPGEPDRGLFGPVPPWIGWLAVAAAMLPAFNCLQRGQVEVAKMYLLLLGFRLIIERRSSLRSLLGGLTFALAIALKVTPVLPAAFVLGQQFLTGWREAWPRWARWQAGASWLGTIGGLAIFFFLLPAACVGWSANLRHLDTWWNRVVMRVETTTADNFAGDSYSVRNQSLTNATHRLGNWIHYQFAGGPFDDGPLNLGKGGPGLVMDTPLVDQILRGVRLFAACLLLVVGWRTAREDLLGQAAGFGLACVATLVTVPIARVLYFEAVLPGVIFLGCWLFRQGRTRWAVGFVVLPAILIIAHFIFVNAMGRMGVLGLGTAIWYLGGCSVMLAFRRAAVGQDTVPSVVLQGPTAPSRAAAA
jgi:hypothetical protein